MQRALFDMDDADLIRRVHPKFRPVWEGRSRAEQRALALYFLPHTSKKDLLEPTRPRLIKWYCPFAAQCDFPTGHRYCLNVFTGCTHNCEYCYARAYEPACAGTKGDFARLLEKDLEDLETFDVPPAPVHLSNSTDPFQPLEIEHGHARLALEGIAAHRHRFTTVTMLTKNPSRPVQLGYTDLFRTLATLPTDHPRHVEFRQKRQPGFILQCSLAFWREEAAAAYDPGAPAVRDRIAGLRALHAAGIPLVLRIDPLFPRSPLPCGGSLADYGLPEAQTLEDLDQLVRLAKELNVRHVVYSALKVVKPRGRTLSPTMQAFRRVYETCARPDKPVWHGNSWRLPDNLAREHIIQPFLDICARHGVAAKYCKQDLIEAP